MTNLFADALFEDFEDDDEVSFERLNDDSSIIESEGFRVKVTVEVL